MELRLPSLLSFSIRLVLIVPCCETGECTYAPFRLWLHGFASHEHMLTWRCSTSPNNFGCTCSFRFRFPFAGPLEEHILIHWNLVLPRWIIPIGNVPVPKIRAKHSNYWILSHPDISICRLASTKDTYYHWPRFRFHTDLKPNRATTSDMHHQTLLDLNWIVL